MTRIILIIVLFFYAVNANAQFGKKEINLRIKNSTGFSIMVLAKVLDENTSPPDPNNRDYEIICENSNSDDSHAYDCSFPFKLSKKERVAIATKINDEVFTDVKIYDRIFIENNIINVMPPKTNDKLINDELTLNSLKSSFKIIDYKGYKEVAPSEFLGSFLLFRGDELIDKIYPFSYSLKDPKIVSKGTEGVFRSEVLSKEVLGKLSADFPFGFAIQAAFVNDEFMQFEWDIQGVGKISWYPNDESVRTITQAFFAIDQQTIKRILRKYKSDQGKLRLLFVSEAFGIKKVSIKNFQMEVASTEFSGTVYKTVNTEFGYKKTTNTSYKYNREDVITNALGINVTDLLEYSLWLEELNAAKDAEKEKVINIYTELKKSFPDLPELTENDTEQMRQEIINLKTQLTKKTDEVLKDENTIEEIPLDKIEIDKK